MDEKVLFIADYLRQADSVSGLCKRYGVSRKTGHKWIKRYAEGGVDALHDTSRRPTHSPERTPFEIRQAVIELRQSRRVPLGPKKIQALLQERYSDRRPPSKTTLYKILKAEGLVEPQRHRRRAARHPLPFAPADSPNEVWSADFKGQLPLSNGTWCYPLTVMDHASRYLLACQGLEGTRGQESHHVFESLFRTYGLPRRIRTDNGVPFATTAPGGLSRLAIWWIRLGIYPERIRPGKPQQNGRHERMHRTLKRAVSSPMARDLPHQQDRLDTFRHDYNDVRPHEGLEQRCPNAVYQPSTRPYPEHLPEPAYPSHFIVRRVSANGVAYWRGLRGYTGYLLANELIGLEQVQEGQWYAYFGPIRLGVFDERHAGGKTGDYMRLNV